MPIITIESSVPLADHERGTALRTLVAAANDMLAITPPTQLRLRIADVDVETIAVGDVTASNDEPWIVAFCNVLAGRSDAQIEAFLSDFAATIASVFRIDVAKVRILVQTYPKQAWGIGRRSAAAVGR
jgi:phenylpyruvate tautomerase PptA (4-oxalocrotonate tautomerase family)